MASSEREITIEAGHAERHYWRDLWTYRELFYFLAWRDILVRYKQTAIGIAWSVVRPALTMVVFTVVFGRLAKLPSNGIPYPVLVFTAMLPWYFFASAVAEGSNSLVENANIISKVYFPRLIIPMSAVVVSLVDFLISFLLMMILMVWYQFLPDWHVVFLPVFILFAAVVSAGIILWMAALNVKYRDFRYIIPFVIQFGLLISPVGFSSSIVPSQWRLAYSFNPMVGVIDGFRWTILGGQTEFFWPGIIVSAAVATTLLFTGVMYFRKTERSFADII
jgi:lipopolysaccharide transport system permease protein